MDLFGIVSFTSLHSLNTSSILYGASGSPPDIVNPSIYGSTSSFPNGLPPFGSHVSGLWHPLQ